MYSKNIYVSFALSKIFHHEFDLKRIEFDGITSHIKKSNPDSAFNFDYIIKAFSSAQPTEIKKDTLPKVITKEQASSFVLNIKNLEHIRFNNFDLAYIDEIAGLKTKLKLGGFLVEMNDFNFLKSRYHVRKIELKDTYVDLRISKISENQTTTDTTSTVIPKMDIALNLFLIKNLKISYADEISKQNLKFVLGSLYLLPDKIDLSNKKISSA